VYKALLVFASYLLGTFPTARIVVGEAVEREGSGNPGASNAYRTGGRRKGLLVLVGDAAKGALATGAGYAIGNRPLAFACGAAAVVGHIVPLTRPTRGGKGVATAAGMGAVLFPLLALVNAGVWLAVAKLTNRASLASIAALIFLPSAIAITGRPSWELLAIVAVGGLILLRHARNLGRLVRGEERSLQ
jgi:glycerol-3-phosphate acyltransferase PlsY